MMKPRKLLVVLAVLAVPWALVLALLLEVYGAYRIARMERNFKAVQARIMGDESAKETALKKDPAAVAHGPESPIPAGYATQDEDLAAFFQALDEADRHAYVEFKEVVVCFAGADGTISDVYQSPVLNGYLGENARELKGKNVTVLAPPRLANDVGAAFGRVLSTRQHENVQFEEGGPWYRISLFPRGAAGDPNAGVLAMLGTVVVAGPNSPVFQIFEEPWFKYVKNRHRDTLSTNNFGFIDDDVVVPKPAGVFRIVCMGGSCVAEGLTDAETYPNIMQRILNDPKGAFQVDVVNCGVFALSTAGEKKRLFDYLELSPDLIIDYNGQNEFGGTVLPKWQQEPHPQARFFKKSRFIRTCLDPLLLPSKAKIAADIEASSIANLKAISDYLKRKGVGLAVCSFARPRTSTCTRAERDFLDWSTKSYWTHDDLVFASYAKILDVYNRCLKAFCAREQLLYIPVDEEMKGEMRFFKDICHMTHAGTQRKAEIVAQYVKPILDEKGKAQKP